MIYAPDLKYQRQFGKTPHAFKWVSQDKTSVAWAHKNLGPRYSIVDEDEMSFTDLDLRLLVAGELNIIHQSVLMKRRELPALNCWETWCLMQVITSGMLF